MNHSRSVLQVARGHTRTAGRFLSNDANLAWLGQNDCALKVPPF